MSFKTMKVSTRLIVGFGTLIALLLVIIVLGLTRLSGMNDSMETMVHDRVPKLVAIDDLALKAMDNARIVRNIVLLTDEKSLASNKALFEKNLGITDEHIAFLDKSVTNPLALEQLKSLKIIKAAYTGYTNEVLKLGMANKGEEATKYLYGENYKTQGEYFAAIKKLIDVQSSLMEDAAKQAQESYNTARNFILALGALACALGVILAVLITRSISLQLGGEPADAAELARAVAEGDLSATIEVKQGDTTSLMAQLKAMQESLSKVVSTVRGGSEGVATASAEIASGNNDLSARTEQQASALEETAASMEELSSTVKQNADSAKQANQLALTASTVAVQGGEVVSQVVETMKGINDSSKKISDIISVIDGIAFQTNILALNAAVEAARAGEQGRGFAVVASEVRSLAGRSAEAAKEIKSLIGASVERVEQGTALVDKAGATMTEVVNSIKRVTDLMGEISAASNEQSQGVAQVGEAVTQMDQVTQQNAALVEEMAAAATSLKSQAQELVSTVAVFKLSGREHVSQISAPQRPPASAQKTSFASKPKAITAAPKPASKPAALNNPQPQPKPQMASAKAGGDDWESF